MKLLILFVFLAYNLYAIYLSGKYLMKNEINSWEFFYILSAIPVNMTLATFYLHFIKETWLQYVLFVIITLAIVDPLTKFHKYVLRPKRKLGRRLTNEEILGLPITHREKSVSITTYSISTITSLILFF